ncbi:peptidase M23 [candidate division KSB3 bacterium]|uniref:Peptidase M23 n=1 Tax=candidate division KSB3 bacterium TaxID=2044937 RepID=A0A2G6KFC6_9BACT|nr:MAG: peptidase M23 [candidate division KSB3 bacterium]
MSKKYFTLLVVPDATAQFKQIKIPYFLIKASFALAALIALTIGGISYYTVNHYHDMQEIVIDLPEIRKTTSVQQSLLKSYEEDITELHQMVSRLKLVNAKLMLMAGVENPMNVQVNISVGGEDESGLSDIVNNFKQETEETVRQKLLAVDHLKTSAMTQEELAQRMMEYFQDQQTVLASTPSIWPVKGWITSGFGMRKSPFTGKRSMHSGLDIATKSGTPISAPADGIVSYSGKKGAYGNVLVIDHGNGYVTFYGHCKKLYKKVGERIKRGDLIAEVGNTGRSTGSHLHYEVRVNGVATNPSKYILDM